MLIKYIKFDMEPITASILLKPAAKMAERLLAPLYNKIESSISKQTQVAYHRIFNSYERYLADTFRRHSYFVSIVFKNEQKLLLDYYVPLTIDKSSGKKRLVLNRYPVEEIESTGSLLIVDTAGMGKTTILKYLFLKCVEQEAGVPIFIELRKLTKRFGIVEFILKQLSDVAGNVKEELFFELLKSGEFVFFLDGYDEIPDSERAEVTAGIQNFLEKTRGNKFILTSRDEAGLLAFPEFQRYTIRPLETEEAYGLLRKYANSELSESLIERLELPENAPIHEFLTNPLLTSLLYKSYEYKHVVPLTRHIFYRQVYEALYDAHDLTKQGGEYIRVKKSGLNIDRLESILKELGGVSYRAGKVEFTKTDALDMIEKAKTLCAERKPHASDIYHDLTHAVPLLIEDGNYVRWSHRSIQEYFAAASICKLGRQRCVEVLAKYFSVSEIQRHANLVTLCADMDRQSFDNAIGRRIAEQLLSEFDALFPTIPTGATSEQILLRKELTVGRSQFTLRVRLQGDDSTNKVLQAEHARVSKALTSLGIYPLKNGGMHQNMNPGVGAGTTETELVINPLMKWLPFISPCPKTGRRQRDVLKEEPDPNPIDDKLENIVNAPNAFNYVNHLLTEFTPWRFDSRTAREFIVQLDRLAREQAGIDAW